MSTTLAEPQDIAEAPYPIKNLAMTLAAELKPRRWSQRYKIVAQETARLENDLRSRGYRRWEAVMIADAFRDVVIARLEALDTGRDIVLDNVIALPVRAGQGGAG